MADSFAVKLVDDGRSFSFRVVFDRDVSGDCAVTLRSFSGAQTSNRRQGVIPAEDAARLAAWLRGADDDA